MDAKGLQNLFDYLAAWIKAFAEMVKHIATWFKKSTSEFESATKADK